MFVFSLTIFVAITVIILKPIPLHQNLNFTQMFLLCKQEVNMNIYDWIPQDYIAWVIIHGHNICNMFDVQRHLT